MLQLGVLDLQGSVVEHFNCLAQLENVHPVLVKKAEQIKELDGIILPGGESTTIAKLLKIFNLEQTLKKRIQTGMPVWGTCAGLILLAKEIVGEQPHLGLMNMRVCRNAYGRQINSFETQAIINEVSNNEIPLVFIRAPWIESVGPEVKVLCQLDGHTVAVRQGNMLATAFHPELSNDLSVHRYFAELCMHQKELLEQKVTSKV